VYGVACIRAGGWGSMSRGDVVMFKDFSSYVLIPVINLNFLIVFKYEGIV
jgi:hypothetical protein